jgi:predicted transcriptional regulator
MSTSKIKDRYMTIRLPADIEIELRKMAERNTRTLAAQILHCVKMELERQQAQETKA